MCLDHATLALLYQVVLTVAYLCKALIPHGWRGYSGLGMQFNAVRRFVPALVTTPLDSKRPQGLQPLPFDLQHCRCTQTPFSGRHAVRVSQPNKNSRAVMDRKRKSMDDAFAENFKH